MRLRWTRLAIHDLHSAIDYIAERDPNAAATTRVRIESATVALSQYPEMGRTGRVAGTRELVISGTPFITAYRIAIDTIDILAIIHGARRWPDRF